MKTGALVSAYALLIGACVVGPPPAPPRQTDMGLRISGLELSNGLRVVLVQDPRAPEIQVTMRYQVGSVDDPPQQAGVAHLVEHLMFQQVLGGRSLFAHLEDVATSFNAATTFDATTFFERAQVAHLDELISIEAVRVGFRCTTLTDSAFAREREVVVNELRQRDDATEILSAVHDGIYPAGHPYRRPVGGTEASVEAITRDQACTFADAHYGPGNAVLVVSGDLTPHQLKASLSKFMAHLPRRDVPRSLPVPRVEPASRRVEIRAPIDDEAVLIAWPLPEQPELRAKVRAVAEATRAVVDARLNGRVMAIELGDGRAPLLGLVVFPAAGESIDAVIAAAERGIVDAPGAFRENGMLGELVFDRVQQTAIYNLFATLEDGGDRDTRLAQYAIAGRDPATALGAEFRGLRRMTRDEAAEIARQYLGLDRATIGSLTPSAEPKRGHGVTLAAAVHDLGQRRDPANPADAHRPLTDHLETRGFVGVRTRELPNGLKVVLLPVTSVPTVDVRLIFGSGTADEPADRRGAALVAAYGLTWDPHFINDLLPFAAAGGTGSVDVGTDHTAFTARGLDMHLDLLLAGLRRWVRDGRYDSNVRIAVDALRQEAKKARDQDQGAVTDAWRAALFGAGHPYVEAGLVRHTSSALTPADATQFRAAHFTPDNATLVISGRFDAALAERWIDFLFSDWTGRAQARTSPRSAAQPAAIANDAPTTQVYLQLALPASANRRAPQLVAAAMLDEITGDARQQLGASYGLDATLVESRLATNYVITGWVDAARASETVELIRTRLEKLRTDDDTAARAFVTSRSHVLVHLIAARSSAAMLAERVQRDVELQRAPMSDLATATEVQALTIESMGATLAEIDLSRAVVLMAGPATDIDRAFHVLGRTPTRVSTTPTTAPEAAPAGTSVQWSDPRVPSDYSTALTDQGPTHRLTLSLGSGYSTGKVLAHGVTGYSVTGEVGLRLDTTTSVGLHLSLGHLDGIYDLDTGHFVPDLHPVAIRPSEIAVFLQATGYDRLWASVVLGLHLDRVTDDMVSGTHAGIGVGVEGGVDALTFGRHRLAGYFRVESELASDVSYTALTIGAAYRL